jgi:hypothetical protein
MFLVNVMFGHLPREQKVDKCKLIMDAWKKRIETKIGEVIETNIEEIAIEQGFDVDVARILTNIHQYKPALIRQEYINEVKSVLYSSFSETKT